MAVKRQISHLFNKFGYTITKNEDINKKHSLFDEETIIKSYLDSLKLNTKYICEIGASDGVSMSNTFFLFKENYPGLAIECDNIKFAKLSKIYEKFNTGLIKIAVDPNNINYIFKAFNVPETPALLNLDIDCYDYYVLEKILSEYRPHIISTEINEKIPTPIKFAVLYNQNHIYNGDHFYGQSISQLYDLCIKYDYKIVKLHYNNAFLMPQENKKYDPLTPEQAYNEGYKNQNDRKEKFPWNADMESLLNLPPNLAVEFINEKFKDYQGRYVCNY